MGRQYKQELNREPGKWIEKVQVNVQKKNVEENVKNNEKKKKTVEEERFFPSGRWCWILFVCKLLSIYQFIGTIVFL